MKKLVLLSMIILMIGMVPATALLSISSSKISGGPHSFDTPVSNQRHKQCWWGVNTGIICDGKAISTHMVGQSFNTVKRRYVQEDKSLLQIVGSPGRAVHEIRTPAQRPAAWSIQGTISHGFERKNMKKRWRSVDSNAWREASGY